MIGVLIAITGSLFSVTVPLMFVYNRGGDPFSNGVALLLVLVGLITSIFTGYWAEEVEKLVLFF